MSTNYVSGSDSRGFDRWCAAALVVSAVFALADSTGWVVRLPAGEHLIAYAWVPVLVEAIVLVFVARSFASGRRRDVEAAFLVGFSALALLDVANGLRFLTGGWTGDFAMWFLAAAIQVVVALRALTLTVARPRRPVPMPRVFTIIVAVAVLVGFAAAYGDFFGADLLAFVAITAIPAVALRRAESAVPMLWGLTASLLLCLATRLIGEYSISDVRFSLEISVAVVPAVVFLVTLAGVTLDRVASMSDSMASGVASTSASGE